MKSSRSISLSRRGLVRTSAAACGALALSACSGGTSAGSDATEKNAENEVIVVMSPSNEPDGGFDPCIGWGCGEHVHEPLIQSTLITTTADMGFKNDLATSYACSEDALVWTFEIRDDVSFSDGSALHASDVAFTINAIRSSAIAQADLSMVERAEAISDTVLEIHLSKPCNTLLYTLAVMGIVPERAYGDDYGSTPIGSGRYLLEQWDKGQQVVLSANPSYYGDAPAIDRVVVLFMEEDAALAAVRSGQADVAYTSATYADQSVDGFELASYKTVDSRGINLPVIPSGATKEDGANEYPAGNDVTCNLEIRQAINYALDREQLVEDTLSGHGHAAYSIGDGLPWASDDMRVATDREHAKELLDQGGWTVGSDGVLVKDGVRASFDLYYSSGDSVRQAMANAFASQMDKIGIEVVPKGASWDDIYPNEFSSPVLWGWGSNSPSDVYELNYSAGTMNYSCYESDVTDSYLDQALAQQDIEGSYEYWCRAQWDGEEGIAPQGSATWVWLANVDHLYWVRQGLHVAEQKLQPHGHGWSLLNNVDTWNWE